MNEDFKKALAFVQEKHKGQTHANDVPVWYHLARVSRRLEYFLNHFKEGSAEERKVIATAALGHDLLEDTQVTEDEVKNIFGSEGLRLIKGMTNEEGDEDVSNYVQKMSVECEEVRLIKLSDLFDNINSVTVTFSVLGNDWIHSFFLRVVSPMVKVVTKTEFKKYPETGGQLKMLVLQAHGLLLDVVDEFK
jgi:(p)ppGpp synthase/HD superfamily hydrolase